MIRITAGETAWVDQQNAALRDALSVVLDRITVIDINGDPETVREQAEQVGEALYDHIGNLDYDELETLACTAVVRLAERIHGDRRIEPPVDEHPHPEPPC